MTSTKAAISLVAALGCALGCASPQYQDCKVRCGAGDRCPAPLQCVHGFCNDPGSLQTCEGAAIDGGPDGVDAGADDGLGATPAAIVAFYLDRATTLIADEVSRADDGTHAGDGPDGVFHAVIEGPADALVLVTVADAEGGSLGDAASVWDTLAGEQALPPGIPSRFSRGDETPILGVSVDGVRLANEPQGNLPTLGPGQHRLKLFANDAAPTAFTSGRYFRLGVVRGPLVLWGPSLEFSWGRPVIDSFVERPDSMMVNLVGPGDSALTTIGRPPDWPDGAFQIHLFGPLDALMLISTDGLYMWDTIVGSAPIPAGVAADPQYQYGSDTWILGVSQDSVTLLNNRDGTLPRLNGEQTLILLANDTDVGSFVHRTYQVVGAVGDVMVWSPPCALP